MPHCMGSHCRGTRRPTLPPGQTGGSRNIPISDCSEYPAATDPAASEFKTEPAVDKNWTMVTYKIRYEAHSEHRFPDPFLQTLPELVTPLKGHSLSLYLRVAVHRRCQRPPPEGLGTNRTVREQTLRPSTHVNMRRVRPGIKKEEKKTRKKRLKEFRFDSDHFFYFLFVLA